MGHVASTHRSRPLLRSHSVSSSPKSASPRPLRSDEPRPRRGDEPRLLPLLLPVLILGGLAMLHVVSLARLSELEGENRRLERLTLEQTMRHGELMRERGKLTNTAVLFNYAAKRGMVSPASITPVRVGVLPAEKIYWALPGEVPGQLSNLRQIGQLMPPGEPASRRL